MQVRPRSTYLWLAAALLAGGCFGGGFETDEALLPLSRADGHRSESPPQFDHVLEIAYDRATAERAWQENVPDESVSSSSSTGPGLFGDLGDVDFETQALVVWSSGDAGDACATWLANVHTHARDGQTRVTVELGKKEPRRSVCTAAYRPYRMIYAVERDRLPAPDELPIDDIEGVRDGLIDAYP